MANIYRVIQMKLNQLLKENVHVIADLPTKRIWAHHNDKHFSEFYLQDGGRNQVAWIWNKITSLSPYV